MSQPEKSSACPAAHGILTGYSPSAASSGFQPGETRTATDPFDNSILMEEIRTKLTKVALLWEKDPYPQYPPPGSAPESWQECARLIDKHDAGLCQAYREQIDTLLVFAGLFSAVVTAFTVESYQWLQDDPNEKTAELLAHIANLLAPNHSAAIPYPVSSPAPAASVVRINIYWFLALTLSLSSALVAIVSKQWIREFERDIGRPHKTALGVRQMKFEGLEAWRVGDIVSSVPLLLQLALALFMAGVLELLWRLHAGVAAAITLVAAFMLLFYTATSFLPLVQFLALHLGESPWEAESPPRPSQCPYKSPQAWLALRSVLSGLRHVLPAHRVSFRPLLKRYNSWLDFDLEWAVDADQRTSGAIYPFSALRWLVRNVGSTELPSWIARCLHDRYSTLEDLSYPDINAVVSAPHSFRPRLEGIILPPKPTSWMLLAYFVEVQWGPEIDAKTFNTVIELFLRAIHTSPDITSSSKYLRRIGDKLSGFGRQNNYERGQFLDPNLAAALVMVIERVLDRNRGTFDSGICSVIQNAIQILRRATEQREELMAAICACATSWLRSVPLADADTSMRLSHAHFGVSILHSLLQVYRGDLGLKPVHFRKAPYIRIIASLARHAAETFRSMFPGNKSVDWGIFNTRFTGDSMPELLKIAGSDIIMVFPDIPRDFAQPATASNASPHTPIEPEPQGATPPSATGNGTLTQQTYL